MSFCNLFELFALWKKFFWLLGLSYYGVNTRSSILNPCLALIDVIDLDSFIYPNFCIWNQFFIIIHLIIRNCLSNKRVFFYFDFWDILFWQNWKLIELTLLIQFNKCSFRFNFYISYFRLLVNVRDKLLLLTFLFINLLDHKLNRILLFINFLWKFLFLWA